MIRRHRPSSGYDLYGEQRRFMIRETEAFLNFALGEGRRRFPRVPRRRVSEGGFVRLLKQPGARRAMMRWWDKTLAMVGELV